MPSQSAPSEAQGNPDADIVFGCTRCGARYVVEAAAAGAILQCQNCREPITVPQSGRTTAPDHTARISELQHQLKENESQRTEITSYINQHSIALHRWQLRLKALNERQQKLQTELSSLAPSTTR